MPKENPKDPRPIFYRYTFPDVLFYVGTGLVAGLAVWQVSTRLGGWAASIRQEPIEDEGDDDDDYRNRRR